VLLIQLSFTAFKCNQKWPITRGIHFNRMRRNQYGMEKFQLIMASYLSRSKKMTLNFILTDEARYRMTYQN